MSGLRQLLGGARRCSHVILNTQTKGIADGSAQTLVHRQQLRGFASGSGDSVTFEGVTLHKPARWHVMWGTGMCSIMWFWVLYRAYYDGETLLYGHAIHFEHDDHDDHSKGTH